MPRQPLLLASFVALGLAILFSLHESRVIARQREQVAASRALLAQAATELAGWRQTRDRLGSDAAAAEKQLTEFSVFATGLTDPAARERDAEVKAWLGRVKQLRGMFAEHPEQQIPEMTLLTDSDWFRVTRTVRLDSEEQRREAFARIRAAAKGVLGPKLASALTKYATAHDGQTPGTVLELAPYFSTPIDPAILQRYAMSPVEPTTDPARSLKTRGFNRAIEETAAVDADYDTRTVVTSNGSFGFLSAPSAWIENFEQLRSLAIEAYAKANHGAISLQISELLPYMDPPPSPAVAERLLRAEQREAR
jgi:hypothetical protein